MQGYGHAAYAASLSEFGTPRFLPHSNGWLLERALAGFPYRDAMGCYPIFVCQDWKMLREDLDDLSQDLVSVVAITDPFGDYDSACLNDSFKDVVVPFKQHFVTDLGRSPETLVKAHHRRNIRRAAGCVSVEVCKKPLDFLEDWITLYTALVRRHGIRGMLAFSREVFSKQFRVPGLMVLRAISDRATAGMLLWYVRGDVAYYHLGAYSQRGYECLASFALFGSSIEYFAQRGVRWLDLGAGAGVINSAEEDGLSRFKRGWSTGMRTAYLCGRIFDRQRYQALVEARNISTTDYFPAYRKGEFG